MDGGFGIIYYDVVYLDVGFGWRFVFVFICCEILGRLFIFFEFL